MYARDVSKKTKAAKKAKARDGQFIGSKAPFGYKIDPNDRHHLIVDEPAAQVVKRIFRLASEGVGYNKMAKIFREEKVLTPIAYFNLNNPDYFKSDYWRKEFDWHVTSIRAILNNEVYLGKLVYGKQRNKSMKSKEKVRNPKEDWIVVEKLPRAYHYAGTVGYGTQNSECQAPSCKGGRGSDVCRTSLLFGLRSLPDLLAETA
ncbi:MAG: recombinase family protein [Ruminococcus sp.]